MNWEGGGRCERLESDNYYSCIRIGENAPTKETGAQILLRLGSGG
jgi:hypothetical protein